MTIRPPYFLFLWIAISAIAQIQNAPQPLQLRQGQSYKFNANCPAGKTCKFELAPGHDPTSKISADGLYQAPVKVQQHGRIGGCPSFFQNHVYNVRIDEATSKLPTHPSNADYLANLLSAHPTAAYKGPHGGGGSPVNVMTRNTRLIQLYSPTTVAQHWNGDIPLETPGSVGYGSRTAPLAATQSSWGAQKADNRYQGINKDDCMMYEVYSWGDWLHQTPPISASGADYFSTMEALNGDGLRGDGSQGATAGGFFLAPIQLVPSEVMRAAATPGGDIGHMLSITLSNGAIASQGCCGGVGHVWPASSNSWSGFGKIPYGTRFRLDPAWLASYDVAKDTADPKVQAVIMTMLNTYVRYGFAVMDGTTPFDGFGYHSRYETGTDPAFTAAMTIIAKSPNISSNWTVPATYDPARNMMMHLQAVDLAPLMVSKYSNVVHAPFAAPEWVLYKDSTGAIIDQRDITIIPPTIGAIQTQVNVVAGASVDIAQHVWATGLADNRSITYSILNGAPGTISDQGRYTPPADLAAPIIVQVRATSSDDATVYHDERVVALPSASTALCLRMSNVKNVVTPACTWWSQDANGQALTIGGTSATPMYRASNLTCTHYPAAAYNGGDGGDQAFALQMPPGKYKVTTMGFTGAKYAPGDCTGDEHCNPTHLTSIEMQNKTVWGPTNFYSLVNNYWDGVHVTQTIEVGPDGLFTYAFRRQGTGSAGYPRLSSVVIEPE